MDRPTKLEEEYRMGTDKFDNLEKLAYGDIREDIKTGDILLCSGNHPISLLIRKFSKSLFSHIGFVFSWNNRVLVLESVEDDGVRAVPLSQYVADYENSKRPYDGRLFMARYKQELDKDKIKQMLGRAADLLNRKYDKDEIGKIILRITTGIGKHKTDNEYICSEFIDECFKEIEIVFERDKKGFIFPEHIAADPNVDPLFEFSL